MDSKDNFHFDNPEGQPKPHVAPLDATLGKGIGGVYVVSPPGNLTWADKFSSVPFVPPTIQEQIWTRIRVEDGCVLLEVQYGDNEYVVLTKEPLLSNFSHESRIWPIADRSGVKLKE